MTDTTDGGPVWARMDALWAEQQAERQRRVEARLAQTPLSRAFELVAACIAANPPGADGRVVWRKREPTFDERMTTRFTVRYVSPPRDEP